MIRSLIASALVAATFSASSALACSRTPLMFSAGEIDAVVTAVGSGLESHEARLVSVTAHDTIRFNYVVTLQSEDGNQYQALYHVRWEPNRDPNGPNCSHPVATKVAN